MASTEPSRRGAPSREVIHLSHQNGACTHLTMTRLYTDTFRCQSCLKLGSMGWVYKCTQDQELILEDMIEKQDFAYDHKKVDSLADLFERPVPPRKRSPEARASKLSFLEEISDTDIKDYTRDQLNRILCQRAHLLDTIAAIHGDDEPESCGSVEGQGLEIILPSSSSLIASCRHPTDSPSRTSSKPLSKPWLPRKDCQFKCCHFCRATCLERSWLSLNAIVSGELPATAMMGYGFHLRVGKHKRPVALIEHVKHIGLRPHIPPRPKAVESAKATYEDGYSSMSSTFDGGESHRSENSSSTTHRTRSDGNEKNPSATLAEDRATQEKAARKRAPASAIPRPVRVGTVHGQNEADIIAEYPMQVTTPKPEIASQSVSPLHTSTSQHGAPVQTDSMCHRPFHQRDNSLDHGTDYSREVQEIFQRVMISRRSTAVSQDQIQSGQATCRSSLNQQERSRLEKRVLPPLPSELPGHTHVYQSPGQANPTPILRNTITPASKSQYAAPTYSSTMTFGNLFSFPAEDQLSSARSTAPATPMEADEEWAEYFSSEPLKVKNGLAITEEALELHVPDVLHADCDTMFKNGS